VRIIHSKHPSFEGLDLQSYQNRMSFPDYLERGFQDYYFEKSIGINRLFTAAGLVTFALFGIGDNWTSLSLSSAWLIRFGVICPLLGILLLFSFTRFYKPIMQPMASLVSLAVCLGSVAIMALARKEEVGVNFYFVGLMLTLLVIFTFFRLSFGYAAAVGWITFGAYQWIAIFRQGMLSDPNDIVIFAVSNFYLISVNLVGMAVNYFTQLSLRRDFLQQRMIEQERAKSERLLLNVLPAPIAERLKRGEAIADQFAAVSVLFADIANFTPLSERLPPEQLIALLNQAFSAFDQLAEKHGLEKIKTIGDAYMVVSGLPLPRSDHAEALADMALDMQKAMVHLRRNGLEGMELRIGMSSGPVVAGVVGLKKFIYDLWGDTVNTASRMESHGVAGEIQVSKATYTLLKDLYTFEARGIIPVKGKGEMPVYLLKGKNI
jgi:class 3 adenylate cyclase